MSTLFILLIIYQIKHFLADYPLQGKYMLGKFKPYPDFIKPLLAHAAVHGAFTFAIAICLKPLVIALGLAALDMGIHFLVDRVKASPKMLGRFKAVSANEMRQIMENAEYFKEYPYSNTTKQTQAQDQKKLRDNVLFWWSLGADQMAHHLTHYLIIWCLL